MRRVIAFCLALVLALSCAPLCAAAPVRAGEASVGSLIKERCYTYEDGQKYSGKTVTPQLDVSAFADLTVVEDGGSHTDGRGEPVFSNYVVFSVKLNFDSSKRIIGTDARVSKDRCDWNETAYAAAGDTEQYIAYGAIGAERRDGEGKKVSYEPMFSKGNTSVENLVFNEDGNYTVFVLYESVKDGKYQNHVIEWSFSIRSYVYLVDDETGYPIKESGTSDRTVRVDYAKRQGVTLECAFTDVDGRTSSFFASDGYRMEQSGTYRFTTRAAGFVCESFTFLLDTSSPCDRLMFANLCRMIGEYSYEAEGSFYFTWTERVGNPLTVTYDYYNGESETPVTASYVAGTVLDQPGYYFITVDVQPFPIKYVVFLIGMEAPSQNREMLSGERFNNFKTKWYEVYDRINGRYLCFDVSEYDLAYEAAMTVENSTVNTTLGTLYYNGIIYPNRIELTAVMHENAVQNIKTAYYDPADYTLSEESERVFSPNAFDGTSYLNEDFQFVTSHPSETERIEVKDATGAIYSDVAYFLPVGEQATALPHGVLEITETDCYGNATTYRVKHDVRAPQITLLAPNGSTVVGENGSEYTVGGYFGIAAFSDDLDGYAVLRVTRPDGSAAYFYMDEYLGIVFEDAGTYTLCGYDRNGNSAELSITVN